MSRHYNITTVTRDDKRDKFTLQTYNYNITIITRDDKRDKFTLQTDISKCGHVTIVITTTRRCRVFVAALQINDIYRHVFVVCLVRRDFVVRDGVSLYRKPATGYDTTTCPSPGQTGMREPGQQHCATHRTRGRTPRVRHHAPPDRTEGHPCIFPTPVPGAINGIAD